jgi:hypothetical protein
MFFLHRSGNDAGCTRCVMSSTKYRIVIKLKSEVYPILQPLLKEIKVDNLVRFPSFV